MPPGFNLTADLGMDDEGVPETIVIPGIAGEYATRFFREAYKRGGERVAKGLEVELNALAMSVRTDPDWDILTTSPFFSLEQKQKAVRERCQKLKLSPFFTNRILSLLDKEEDIGRLQQIRYDYEELMRSFRRERQLVLVTGKPLSPQELEFFKHSMKVNYLSAGDQMVFSHQIDPTIAGGLRVIIDGNVTDHSWSEKNISDAKGEFEAEGYVKLKPAPPPPQLGLDPELLNMTNKYLSAVFTKEEVAHMNSYVIVKKA